MSLGIILAPYGKIPGAYPSAINYSYGGNGTYLCPPDPQFNTHGEPGLYYDTQLGAVKASWWQRFKMRMQLKRQLGQLGAIPTDFELSRMYQYTPVTSGWVASKEAYWPGGWLPPNGWNPAGSYGPQPTPRQLADAQADAQAQAAAIQAGQPVMTAGDVISVLNAHNQRVFALTLVSTAAVAIGAILGAYRTLKILREK